MTLYKRETISFGYKIHYSQKTTLFDMSFLMNNLGTQM